MPTSKELFFEAFMYSTHCNRVQDNFLPNVVFNDDKGLRSTAVHQGLQYPTLSHIPPTKINVQQFAPLWLLLVGTLWMYNNRPYAPNVLKKQHSRGKSKKKKNSNTSLLISNEKVGITSLFMISDYIKRSKFRCCIMYQLYLQ